MQLTCMACMESCCPGACGQIEGDNELMQDADALVVVDATCVMHDVMRASPLHNPFAETRGAMVIVILCVLWFVMHVPVCDVVGS